MEDKKRSIAEIFRKFIIPFICFIIIPLGLAHIINSFFVSPYLNNVLKMEFSYYKESIYYLMANNSEMNEKVRGDLNRFCVSGIFPFVNGFSNTDNEKKKDLEDIKQNIEDYVLDEKKEEHLKNIKQMLSDYVIYEEKEKPEKVVKEFEDYIFTILLFSFYFLELCFFIILQWKFKSDPTITYTDKKK